MSGSLTECTEILYDLRSISTFLSGLLDELIDGTARFNDMAIDVPRFDHADETTERVVGEMGQYTNERKGVGEVLARAKLQYNRQTTAEIRDGDWSRTPFCLDAVYAAIASVTDDEELTEEVRTG